MHGRCREAREGDQRCERDKGYKSRRGVGLVFDCGGLAPSSAAVPQCLSGQGRASEPMHRGNKPRAHLFLRQKGIGATAIGNLLIGVAGYRCDKYDDDLRPSLTNGRGGLQAVHQRHSNIHENQVRLQVRRKTDGLKPIASFSDDPNLQVAFEEIPDSPTELLVIIDNQNSDHC